MSIAVGPQGCEWVVEAHGCEPEPLRSLPVLKLLFDDLVRDLSLHPVGDACWHAFPGPGGVTGLWLLAESHLACHTFPEHGCLCLNVFCCRPRDEWPFDGQLRRRVSAASVRVRRIERTLALSVGATP